MTLFELTKFVATHPLNRTGRVKALWRFARWQVASRLLRRPVVLPFVSGTSLLTENGMTGATGNWYCGLHEHNEMGFVLHALRPGDLFLDVGANVGSYTILAAGAVGAQVIAVEPLPSTFSKLQSNIAYNMLFEQVDAQCCGLSSDKGVLRFTSGLDTMNRVALDGENVPSVNVPVTTMDDLCRSRVPRIIKIDVEGHEAAVLKGGQSILKSPSLDAVLMETNGSGDKFGISDSYLINMMGELGFTPCLYDAIQRKLSPAQGDSNNTIFVRNPHVIQTRCQESRSFSLINGSI